MPVVEGKFGKQADNKALLEYLEEVVQEDDTFVLLCDHGGALSIIGNNENPAEIALLLQQGLSLVVGASLDDE